MTTLYLTLKKKPFDIMISGEKKFEYRNNSKWIESRLINSKNKVNGDIHQTEKIANLLETVDSIEGFLGYNASSLFTRILTLSDSNMCWTYLWNRGTNHPIIESGNWESWSA